MREPWFTKEVECLVKRKREVYVRMRKQGSVGSLEGYKVARNGLKKGLRRARRGHEKSLAGQIKENPKAFYSYVRNKRMTRVMLGPVKDSSGNLCMESEEIGEAMNEYFSSVFTKERGHVFEDESVIQADRLEEVDVLREDVLAILKNLRVDKSPGPDGKYPRILWEARDEIAEPLASDLTVHGDSARGQCQRTGEWRMLFICSRKEIGMTLVIIGRLVLLRWLVS